MAEYIHLVAGIADNFLVDCTTFLITTFGSIIDVNYCIYANYFLAVIFYNEIKQQNVEIFDIKPDICNNIE